MVAIVFLNKLWTFYILFYSLFFSDSGSQESKVLFKCPMPCAGQCPARANAQEHLMLLRKVISFLILLCDKSAYAPLRRRSRKRLGKKSPFTKSWIHSQISPLKSTNWRAGIKKTWFLNRYRGVNLKSQILNRLTCASICTNSESRVDELSKITSACWHFWASGNWALMRALARS